MFAVRWFLGFHRDAYALGKPLTRILHVQSAFCQIAFQPPAPQANGRFVAGILAATQKLDLCRATCTSLCQTCQSQPSCKLPFEAQSRDAPQSRRHLFVPLLDVIIWAMHRPEDLQCTMGLFSKTGHSLEVKFGNVWEIILALYTNPIKPFLLCQRGSFQRKKFQPQKGDLFILQSSNSRYFVVGRLFYPINSNQ